MLCCSVQDVESSLLMQLSCWVKCSTTAGGTSFRAICFAGGQLFCYISFLFSGLECRGKGQRALYAIVISLWRKNSLAFMCQNV